jgi:DNA-binding transcriptional LysR family regulator
MALARRLSFDDLLVFASAARARGFSPAERSIGVTQSAVSHCVAKLERELGVDLFVRQWRGVRLTPAGEILIEAVERGAQAIDAGLAEVRRHSAASRSLTIVTDFGFASLWLLPRLELLRAILPNLDIHILTTRGGAKLDLSLGDAVIAFNAEPPEDWRVTPITPEEVVPVASPGFLSLHQVDHEGLAHAPLLHLDIPDGRWIGWPDYLTARGLPTASADGALTFNNYPILIQAAIAGEGVALGWLPLMSQLINRGILVPCGEQLRTGARGYDFIEPPQKLPSTGLATMRDWFLEQAGEC